MLYDETAAGILVPAKPIKEDDVKRKQDKRIEKREKLATVEDSIRPRTLVLDPNKCHVTLNPMCKSCKHEWFAMFQLENGQKALCCPKCKKMSRIGVVPGDSRQNKVK